MYRRERVNLDGGRLEVVELQVQRLAALARDLGVVLLFVQTRVYV